MTFAPFGNIDANSIYKYLNVPNVTDTISLEVGKFMYKRERNLIPVPEIANHFELRNLGVSHSYNLRARVGMPSITDKSSYGKKSIQTRGSKLWNSLPEEVRSIESVPMFKKKLKTYLLEDLCNENEDDIYVYY